MLHALVLETFYTYATSGSCLGIAMRSNRLIGYGTGLNDTASAKAIHERHESWSARLPDDTTKLWTALTAFNADEQAAIFAHCVSFGIDAVWEPATQYNQGRVSARGVANRIEHSHILARAANLDMVAAGWTATVTNYLGRVTKPQILAAVEEACGTDVAGRLGGMKKPEMASAAEELLQGKGWLAKPLRTPEPAIAADQDPANDDEAADTDGHDGEAIDAVAAE